MWSMSINGTCGDIEQSVTDDIGILRKDNFIRAYAYINETTKDIALKEYDKAIYYILEAFFY